MTTMAAAGAAAERLLAPSGHAGANLLAQPVDVRVRRLPAASIRAEAICEYALAVLAKEGMQALTVRRIAAGLGMSSTTVYKRIGNQKHIIRSVVTLWWSRLCSRIRDCDTWESTATNWCLDLHQAMVANPRVAEAVGYCGDGFAKSYVTGLASLAGRHNVARQAALDCGETLATITINSAICQVRSLVWPGASSPTPAHPSSPDPEFLLVAALILHAVPVGDPTSGQPMRTDANRRSPS